MPTLGTNYPDDAPQFVREPRAAPLEWQEKVQRLDRSLWLCWNEHYRGGPGWCLVRFHGRTQGSFMVGQDQHWRDIFGACKAGWAIVDHLRDPDDRPLDLETSVADAVLADIASNDLKVKYGSNEWIANERLKKQAQDAKAVREDMHDKLMQEAFEETVSDGKTTDIPKPYKGEPTLFTEASP